MRGLLYKEYCIFTAQIKTWLALLLFFIVFSLFTRDIGPLLGGLCASVMIHTFMPFTVERMSRSDRYTGTFPVMRKEIATARYVCLLSWDAAAVFVFGGTALVLSRLFGEDLAEAGLSLAAVFDVALLMQVILLPAIYGLGENRARFAMVAAAAVIAFGGTYAVSRGYLSLTESGVLKITAFCFILSVAAVFPSYLLSAAILEKKDF